MASASTLVAVPHQSRVTQKRLWCQRLACGKIVAEMKDGTLLLCTERFGHEDRCFHSEVLPPRASLVPLLEGCVNE
jgi:hypothetical protein